MAYISQQDKKDLAPGIKRVLNKYGMKGSIAIKHYSSLVVNLQSGPIDFDMDGYTSVNVYHIDRHYTGIARDFLNELVKAMKGTKWFDKSDIMTDYFHTAYYININVGKWNKPYVLDIENMGSSLLPKATKEVETLEELVGDDMAKKLRDLGMIKDEDTGYKYSQDEMI